MSNFYCEKSPIYNSSYKDYSVREFCKISFIEYSCLTVHVEELVYKGIITDRDSYVSDLLDSITKYESLSYKGSNLKLLCIKNHVKYFHVITKLLESITKDGNVTDKRIAAAIKHGIKHSNRSNKFEKFIYPTEEESEKFLNCISNNLFLVNKKDEELVLEGRTAKEICNEAHIDYDKFKKQLMTSIKTNKSEKRSDLILRCLYRDDKKRIRYFYKNVDIDYVCDEKGIDKTTLKTSLTNKQVNYKRAGKDVSMQELYTEFFTKYEEYENIIYEGKKLADYLKDNNINGYTVISYIETYKEKLTGYSLEEMIYMAIYSATHSRTLYFYKKEPVVEFCKRNHLNIHVIKRYLFKSIDNNPDKTLKEIVEKCIGDIEPLTTKECNYRGLSLHEISNLIGVDNVELFTNLIDRLSEGQNINYALFMEVRSHLDYNMIIDGQLLFDYCIDHKYDYHEFLCLINQLIAKKQNELVGEDAKHKPTVPVTKAMVKEAEEKYLARRNPEYLKSMVDFLKTRTLTNNKDLYKPLEFLNIDTYLVCDLMIDGYSSYDAAMMIYYFHDEYTAEHYKSVSTKNINKIEVLKDTLSWNTDYINTVTDIFILIKLYKANIADTSKRILTLYSSFIEDLMNNFVVDKGQKLSSDIIEKLIMEAIDNCYLNDEKGVLDYIESYVKAELMKYNTKTYNSILIYTPVNNQKKEEN